jgi:hypothetical protein
MQMATTAKNTQMAFATQLIAGAKKHLAGATSLTLESTSYTPAQIEDSLQALVDLRAAVDAARAAMTAKIVAERDREPALRRLMTAFVGHLRVAYGNSPDVLADFGIKPKKAAAPLTTEQQAEAVAKRKATRAARHTMGTAQKKKVKGTVTTIVAGTPSTAAAPSGTAAGAPTPVAGGGATPHGT